MTPATKDHRDRRLAGHHDLPARRRHRRPPHRTQVRHPRTDVLAVRTTRAEDGGGDRGRPRYRRGPHPRRAGSRPGYPVPFIGQSAGLIHDIVRRPNSWIGSSPKPPTQPHAPTPSSTDPSPGPRLPTSRPRSRALAPSASSPGRTGTQRVRSAMRTASWRLFTPSLSSTALTWWLTVFTDSTSRPPISASVSPSHSSASTSS
jgi:hypothetical protein